MIPGRRPGGAWLAAGVWTLASGCAVAPLEMPSSPPVAEMAAHRPEDATSAPAEPVTSREAPMMGTTFRVTVHASDSPALQQAIQACFDHFVEVDRGMSEWKPESPVSEINRQAGIAPVPVPPSLYAVLETGRRISEASDGAFDVTWAALRGLWRFDGGALVPPPEAIAARLPLLSWRKLELDPGRRTAFLTAPGMALGLGGIAKGFALQQAADELRRRGFHDFLLYAGGQVCAGGRKAGGEPWRAGVRDPAGGRADFLAVVDLHDVSLSTSGDYENAFVKEGVRYHHIIDPRTGHPARQVRSATVLARDATLADACSTAAFVLGPEKGLAFAQRMGVEALLLDQAGRPFMTGGFRQSLSWSRLPTPDVPASTSLRP